MGHREGAGVLDIYLDTSVYSYVCEAREARVTHVYFQDIGARVLASDALLIETARMKDRGERLRRLAAIRRVSDRRADPPQAYREAMEILSEVRRCRPAWLKSAPDESGVRLFLDMGRRTWKRFRNDVLFDPAEGLPEYLDDAEPATQQFLDDQRRFREYLLSVTAFEFGIDEAKLQEYLDPLDHVEAFWRLRSMGVWDRALAGEPAMRDYHDYLGPYLSSPIERWDWAKLSSSGTSSVTSQGALHFLRRRSV
jgi:hypothetical protein